MPKATAKKKPAVRVGGGGAGTKKSKFNLRVVIPIVLIVAALGGFYIFQKSSAAPARSFSRDLNQIAAGRRHTKSNGVKYIQLGGDSKNTFAYTLVTWSELNASSKVCADVLSYGDATWKPALRLGTELFTNGAGYISGLKESQGFSSMPNKNKVCISTDGYKKRWSGKAGIVGITADTVGGKGGLFSNMKVQYLNIYGEE